VGCVRRTRFAVGAVALGVLFAAVGCGGRTSGGSGGSIPDSASIIPAGSSVYAYLNTDFGGDQWSKLDALLQKFPDRESLLTSLQADLKKHGIVWDDVKAALGPDTAVAELSFGDTMQALLANKANDQAKLDALIQKLEQSGTSTTTQKRNIDGWTVVSDSTAALDKAQAASTGTSLADSQALKDAFDALPSDALAKVFVDGRSVANAVQARGGTTAGTAATIASLGSLGASLQATDDGLALQAVSQSKLGLEPFDSTLIDDVPSGALLYASFKDVGAQITKLQSNPQFQQMLQQLETSLGVTADELAALLSGEGALYVTSGAPLPEVTLLLTSSDPQAAVATLDKLAERAAKGLGTTVQTVSVGGFQAKRLTVRGVPIYYAAVDGKVVVTDSEAGITGLASGSPNLSDDPVYKEATSTAGVPSQTTGMLYVNVKDTVPLVDSFATLAGQSLPPRVTSNLEHVRSLVAYGTRSGDTDTFKAFLEIK